MVSLNQIQGGSNVVKGWWELVRSAFLVIDCRSCKDVIMMGGALRHATRHHAIMQRSDRGGVLRSALDHNVYSMYDFNQDV
jgi:hypothetical protein